MIILNVLILSSIAHCFMLPSTISTVSNYDGRIASFSNWAFGSEALEAQRIRSLFDGYLQDSGFNRDGIILDVGCGPGRDLVGFLDVGYDVIGLEPSQLFCDAATDILSSKYPLDRYRVIKGDICDAEVAHKCLSAGKSIMGAFCLASLFHIPYSKLSVALININSVLAPGGLILSTFPIRNNVDGALLEGLRMPDGRWATGFSVQQHAELLKSHNFSVLHSSECSIYNGKWSSKLHYCT